MQFKCFQLHIIFERLRVFKFLVKLDKQCVKALQITVILLTEDTKLSLLVFKISEQVLLLIHILYMLFLLQVNNFFCDLNFLHENLISYLNFAMIYFWESIFTIFNLLASDAGLLCFSSL